MRACFFRRLAVASFCLLAARVGAQETAVQLLLASRTLEPKSTFELRFPSEMVPADQIGKPAAVSPLVLQPAVAGQFVWLSTRSGTFAPDGVLPLGTKFQITLRPGLKDAAGKDIPASSKRQQRRRLSASKAHIHLIRRVAMTRRCGDANWCCSMQMSRQRPRRNFAALLMPAAIASPLMSSRQTIPRKETARFGRGRATTKTLRSGAKIRRRRTTQTKTIAKATTQEI